MSAARGSAYDCNCAIALRVQSTLATKAIAELSIYDPEMASYLVKQADQHARRLRAACDAGDHGPHAKPDLAPPRRRAGKGEKP